LRFNGRVDNITKFSKATVNKDNIFNYAKTEPDQLSLESQVQKLATRIESKTLKTGELKLELEELWDTKKNIKSIAEVQVGIKERSSFLHFCVMHNQSSLINHLVSNNQNINIDWINRKGETPLHLAVKDNNITIIKLLLHLGASLKPVNFEGKSPLQMIHENNLHFLVEEKTETEKKGTKSYHSKVKSTPKGTVNIVIEDTKDEAIDDMFATKSDANCNACSISNMRCYFKVDKGYISPKNNLDTGDMISCSESDNNVKSSMVTSEEWNISASENVQEKEVDLPLFKSKTNIKPYLNLDKDSTDTTSEFTKRIKQGSSIQTAQSVKVGPGSFRVLKLIGIGSFGEVFLVEKIDTGNLYAMKILKKDKIFSKNLTKYALVERNVLWVSSHPYIVKLHYAFQTPDRLFLIMEYCPGGDLGDYLEAEDCFSEEKARFYISQVILAIEDLHRRGIIYRDLKPDNIVLDKYGYAKLADFGLSKEGMQDIDNFTKSFCGSYAYLAPEMIKKDGHSKTIDWYLLGVVLYELLEGLPPFYSEEKDELMSNIIDKSLQLPHHISRTAKDLLTRLLEKDPSKRLGSENGAEDIKNHKWFDKMNWDDLIRKKIKPFHPYLIKSKEEIKHNVSRSKQL